MSNQRNGPATNAGVHQQQQSLWITHVSAVGPYLKICGQLNPISDLPKLLEESVLPACQAIHNSWPIAHKKQHLKNENIYLVKNINRISSLGETELLRVRLIRFIETQPPQVVLLVEVDFIDMGYSKIIECEELLIAPQGDKLIKMSALSSQYILLGIFGDWSSFELETVLRLIARQTLYIKTEMELQGHKFIKMKWKDWDFVEFLVSQRKIGAPINKDFQSESFSQVIKEHHHQQEIPNETKTTNHNNNNNNTINKNNNNNIDLNKGFRAVLGGRTPSKQLEEANAIKQRYQLEDQLKIQQQKQLLRQQLIQQQQAAYRGMVTPTAGMVMTRLPIHRYPQNINNLQSYMLGIQQKNNRGAYGAGPIFSQYPQASSTAIRLQRPLATPSSPTRNSHNSMLANNKSSKSLPNTGYKINKLNVGSTYDVCVSFVEKGPLLFSVQLNSTGDQLNQMMNRIENIELKNLSGQLTVGMPCVARYSEDGQLYRAVVVNAQPSTVQVIYIDYGNSEFVRKSDIYEITAEFMEERAFALPFALAGIKTLGAIDDSLKKTFKEMVVYKICKLKVTPPEGPPVAQYCELHLQDKNILHVLQEIQKSRLAYPKAAQLSNNDVVEIRFIDTLRNFYVQKVANIDEFGKLMDDMDKYYNSSQIVPQHISIGSAYAVKNDHEWYRAEVIRADEKAIIVRFVDFGYERMVTKNLLSNIAEKHLKMPRQAVHCCLKGFESNDLSNKDIAATQFEMLAEETNGERRLFNVKVFRIYPDEVHVVNLFTKELNVMKKLYKLSMPFEQYLTLEKEDFHMNGVNTNTQTNRKSNDENTTKTYSTSSSNVGDERSSQFSKNSVQTDGGVSGKEATATHTQQNKPVQQQRQPSNPNTQSQPLSPNATPAQRLQQFNNPNKQQHNKNGDCDNNSSASSNVRSIVSDTKQKKQQQPQQKSATSNQQHQQQQQREQQRQQHQQNGRKSQQQQQQELFNSSFESNDRRSETSTNSNRSHNNNATRQKERRQNKEVNSPRLTHQQKQILDRSLNAPQGYSQSRRGSTDSQYSAIDIPIVQAAVTAAAISNKFKKPDEFVPLDYEFPTQAIKTPATEDIVICWWISPFQFYIQRKLRVAAFEHMMRELQIFYNKRSLQRLQLKQGSHVVARHRKDRTYYRARIVACNPMLGKYKVHFVDFGNQYTVTSEDIWLVERRFADFPIMAYYCSFKNIVCNCDHLSLIDRIGKYLPNGVPLTCEYKEECKNLYYVNIKVNNISLLERLKNDRIVTEISPDINLKLLAGQQIRAKIISVKNMLNFKILIEGCDVPLLCTYDDVRFVKSNPDIAQRFKQFYENRSFVMNIKDVDDNKVISLRPLLPLFKADIPTHVCCYPRILQTFKGRVAFIANFYRFFIQIVHNETKLRSLQEAMFQYYENKGTLLTSFEAEKLCAAKSCLDSNWYRARIVKRNKSNAPANAVAVEVYYIDYGNTEMIAKNQIKMLETRFFTDQNAYATEVNLPVHLMDRRQKAEEQNNSAITALGAMLGEQIVTVTALECRRNHLIGEIVTEKGENIVDYLIGKKFVKARDADFMAKQLEKDKSSVLEFIETVDLTHEDEDEDDELSLDKKRQQMKSPNTNSPRKEKKRNNKVENEKPITKAVKNEQQKLPEKPVIIENIVISNVATTPKEVENTKVAGTIEKQTMSQTKTNANSAAIEIIDLVKDSPTLPETNNNESITIKLDDSIIESETSSPISISISSTSTTPEICSNMEQAVLSHCDTPAQFFVHPHDKLEQLHKLQENLQIVASSLPPLMNAYNGANCISFYSVDKQWYRAEIIDAELMVLKFIDFGNTDCVSDATDIKEMSVFPDIEPLCMPCALPIRPNGTVDWVDAANAIFNESYEKILYFTHITQGTHKIPSFINLYIDNVNVAKKLIDDGFAKALEVVDSGENCYISHVNNLNDFYIQYEKDSKALELMEIYLADIEKLPKITECVKHKIVAALFHDDEMWYRAKLLKKLPAAEGYEVLFIDYGNTAVSRECREISMDIANLPPLSKKCALDFNNDAYFGWSEEAETKFAEIAACGETIFNVELCAPATDHAIVNIYIDSLNINTLLEPLCVRRKPKVEETHDFNASFGAQSVATIDPSDTTELYSVVISNSNGPHSFYVQFEKDSERLEDLKHTLNTCVGMDVLKDQPEIGKLYAAVYDDDQQLYRARVLSIDEKLPNNYEVLFIDYGNKAVVNELRILPYDVVNIRAIAKNYTLNGLSELTKYGDVTEVFQNILDATDGVVKLSFADTQPSENAPGIVDLYTPQTNENIFEQIRTKMQTKQTLVAPKIVEPASKLLLCKSASLTNQCLISHANSPHEFYIQLQAHLPQLECITNSLTQSAVESMQKVATVPALNQIYAVFAEEDNLYYRGRVICKHATTPNAYEAQLVDYGNTIIVKELRELPQELKSQPSTAFLCKLSEFPPVIDDNVVLNEHFTALVDAHFGEYFELVDGVPSDFIDKHRNQNVPETVQLSIDGENVVAKLSASIQSGISPLSQVIETKLNECVIVQVNSTSSFYIQLLENTAEIEQITFDLLDAETQFEQLSDLQVGTLCAAQFLDDGAFYRASILKVLEEETRKCLVHFIDFGNDSITTEFRKLSGKLSELPRFSKHCALDVKFEACEAATGHLQTYINEHCSETFQVEFLKQQNSETSELPTPCRLFIQSKNVATEIESLLKDA